MLCTHTNYTISVNPSPLWQRCISRPLQHATPHVPMILCPTSSPSPSCPHSQCQSLNMSFYMTVSSGALPCPVLLCLPPPFHLRQPCTPAIGTNRLITHVQLHWPVCAYLNHSLPFIALYFHCDIYSHPFPFGSLSFSPLLMSNIILLLYFHTSFPMLQHVWHAPTTVISGEYKSCAVRL